MPRYGENEIPVADLSSAHRIAADYRAMAETPLRLGIMCTIGAMRFMPFLARLRRDFPGLRLRVTEATADRLGTLLERGVLDLAVMAQPAAFAPGWHVAALYRERFVVGLPPGHKLSAGDAVALADLDGENYVERASCEYGGHIDALLEKRGVSLNVVFTSEREDWAQMMIVAGAGVACMPEFSPLLPGLATRPLVEPVVTREIGLVALSRQHAMPAAATFAQAIKAYDWTL